MDTHLNYGLRMVINTVDWVFLDISIVVFVTNIYCIITHKYTNDDRDSTLKLVGSMSITAMHAAIAKQQRKENEKQTDH